MTDEGSEYRPRAISYCVIMGNDTSNYTCVFTQLKTRKVNIRSNISPRKRAMTYKQRLKELKLIFAKASKDFNFDSLQYISLGRLVESGDLAIDITKEYKQKYGTFKNLFIDYNKFADFLTKSKLGRDLEDILKPYSTSIASISVEKLLFTTKEELYSTSEIETDKTQVPEEILDCQIVVRLKKHKNNYP
jgi:hypothetical protein